jgi:uridine phosphorylase
MSAYEAPHLKIGMGVISPLVIVVGDPFRTEIVARLCDSYKEVAWNREYRTFNCEYQSVKITITSHGIGGAGAGICFEELIKLGAEVIIRLGTCGSLKPQQIHQGEIVIATAAAREDGHTEYFVPKSFPAVADGGIALMLKDEFSKISDAKVSLGVFLTSSIFYPGPSTGDTLKAHADAGCLAVDMEMSTLLTIASVRGIRAGGCAVIDGSPFLWGEGEYDPHGTRVADGKQLMFQAGLNTMVNLSKTLSH